RSARRVLARAFRGERQRRASRRTVISRGPGLEFRLAVLLFRLQPEETSPQPRIRRGRERSGTVYGIYAASGCVSRALGTGRPDVLRRRSIPQEISGRGVHRLPRILEPRADAAGWLQRHVPTVRRRQAVGGLRGVRERLRRKRPVDESGRCRFTREWRRASPGRFAVRRGEPERQRVARVVSRTQGAQWQRVCVSCCSLPPRLQGRLVLAEPNLPPARPRASAVPRPASRVTRTSTGAGRTR